MQLHGQLHWDHGAPAALLVESPVTPGATPVENSRRDDQRESTRATWIVWALIAVAASVLLACTIGGLRDRAAPDASSLTIATVESVQGVVVFRAAQEERLLAGDEPQPMPSGRAAGAVAPGGHLHYEGHRPLADLWLTLARIGGVDRQRFADSTAVVKELG